MATVKFSDSKGMYEVVFPNGESKEFAVLDMVAVACDEIGCQFTYLGKTA